jgi:hypothetical protein
MKNPTPPIELLQAREIINPRRVVSMLRAYTRSVELWSTVHMPTGGLGATARWEIIHDHFYQLSSEELAWDDGYRFYDSHNQQALIFDDTLLVRCKKFDKRLRTSNYLTPTATDFIHAERQLSLDGLDGLHRLHFGHLLNVIATAPAAAFITLPKGDPNDFNYWVWQIFGDQRDSSLLQEQLRLPDRNGPVLPNRRIKYMCEDYSDKLG